MEMYSMKDKNKSKKVRYFKYAVYFICTILPVFLMNEFDTQIMNFVHSINIFSKLPDNITRFIYTLVIILIWAKVFQEIIEYFSKKYNV
ncbi:MAG: hypothetical protein M3Z87_10940, partial [Lactobacillus sp.]|nr:hypothetical protein [Lactobacillus sp.]